MRTFFFISLFLLQLNCQNKTGIKVEVHNLSGEAITEVNVFTSEPEGGMLDIGKIESSEKYSDFLEMSNNYQDGGYIIEFKRGGSTVERSGGGYYTNEAPLDSKVIFIIEPDTANVVFRGYGF